ncbi:MAG TPA: hypothetical protein VJ385_21435 [Fibrobacteria bacterium]|nr:hypothetical protein [Fibrobacteria bacterium]
MKTTLLNSALILIPFALQACLQESGSGPATDKNQLGTSAAVLACGSTLKYYNSSTNGRAYDIGAGKNWAWVVGTTANGSQGYRMFKWDGGLGWSDFGGAAEKISTTSTGRAFCVNKSGKMYFFQTFVGGTWEPIAGLPSSYYAKEIAVNDTEAVYVVGSQYANDYKGNIYKRNKSTGAWNSKSTDQARQVAVDEKENVFMTKAVFPFWDPLDGEVGRLNSDMTFSGFGYVAVDIAAAGNGILFSVNPNGHIQRYDTVVGCQQELVDQNNTPLIGTRIDAADGNSIWYLKSDNTIWRAFL